MRNRGISHAIATIILTAVAIAIALIVAAYVFGIFGAASTMYGLRVLVNGPSYSNGSVIFTIINTGREVAEIPYIEINNDVFTAGGRCLITSGGSGVLVLVGNGTYIISAKLSVGNCTATYSGVARLYGINSVIIPFTNGQTVIYSTLQFST